VPRPCGFVVKNGSKARATTSGGIPLPVSETVSLTYEPGGKTEFGAIIIGTEADVLGLDREPAASEQGIAPIDGEVEHRISISLGSTRTVPKSPANDVLTAMVSPIERRSRSIMLIMSGCWERRRSQCVPCGQHRDSS
jgi:hypothetical protein